MTSPVETTAAMTPPAEHRDPASGSSVSGVSALAEQAPGRRELSQNAVIGLFGGLVTVLLGALIGLMMWQFDSLGERIDAQGERIDALGTELRAEMDDLESRLRAEMRAGFAEINAVLLDHTDRLARLETAAGLPRASN